MSYTIAALFGLIYGSFLNVVIYRYDDWMSIIKTRSRCVSCGQTLSPLDLVPLLSWAYLRGRCRYCRKPISCQYPLVELAGALLMATGYILLFDRLGLESWRLSLAVGFYILFSGGLVVVFVQDVRDMEISDSALNFLLITALGFALSVSRITDVLYGALVGLTPIALLVYPSKGRWMGEGDVKLATALGIFVGYPLAIVYLASAFMIGGLFGLAGLLTHRLKPKAEVPFGPFLIIGALIALFFGDVIIDWYLGGTLWGIY